MIRTTPYFGWNDSFMMNDTLHKQNFVGCDNMLFTIGTTRELYAYNVKAGGGFTLWYGIKKNLVSTPDSALGRGFTFSPNGKWLVCGGGAGYEIFPTSTFNVSGTPLQTSPGNMRGPAFSADGSYFSCGNNSTKAYVYNVGTTLAANNWTDVTNKTNTGVVCNSTAFSPNGTWWATGGGKDTGTNEYVKAYLQSDWSQITTFTQPAGIVTAISFSPNSGLLACAHTTTPYLTVYDTSSSPWTKLSDVATPPAGNATMVSFNPAGTYLCVSHATTPFQSIYKVSDWSKIASPFDTGPIGAGTAQYSPDGTMLAVSSTSTPLFIVYDISSETYTRRTISVSTDVVTPLNFAWLQQTSSPMTRINT